ncbi:MAG TPA: hypothetical protein VLX28_23220, partial [Thermoanaerobaculia bacterium]|nr:hypothetical protein [Thermoanaerobaculia bacterium]
MSGRWRLLKLQVHAVADAGPLELSSLAPLTAAAADLEGGSGCRYWIFLEFGANQASHGGDGRRLVQADFGDSHFQPLLEPADDPQAGQGVAAQLEEVVVQAHPIDAQNLLPDGGDLLLELVLRRDVRVGEGRTRMIRARRRDGLGAFRGTSFVSRCGCGYGGGDELEASYEPAAVAQGHPGLVAVGRLGEDLLDDLRLASSRQHVEGLAEDVGKLARQDALGSIGRHGVWTRRLVVGDGVQAGGYHQQRRRLGEVALAQRLGEEQQAVEPAVESRAGIGGLGEGPEMDDMGRRLRLEGEQFL